MELSYYTAHLSIPDLPKTLLSLFKPRTVPSLRYVLKETGQMLAEMSLDTSTLSILPQIQSIKRGLSLPFQVCRVGQVLYMRNRDWMPIEDDNCLLACMFVALKLFYGLNDEEFDWPKDDSSARFGNSSIYAELPKLSDLMELWRRSISDDDQANWQSERPQKWSKTLAELTARIFAKEQDSPKKQPIHYKITEQNDLQTKIVKFNIEEIHLVLEEKSQASENANMFPCERFTTYVRKKGFYHLEYLYAYYAFARLGGITNVNKFHSCIEKLNEHISK